MIYTNDIIKKQFEKKRKVDKFFKFIYLPLIILIVLIVAYIGYQKIIKRENSVSMFGFRQYIVATGSMQPTYNVGDLIISRKVPENELKINDVITYAVPGSNSTITHRIVNIIDKNGKSYYQTKGDNNDSIDDELIDYSQIKGKTFYKISQFGTIILNITSGVGAAVVLMLAIIGYIRTNSIEEKRIAREIARRRYNIPRYKKEETI